MRVTRLWVAMDPVRNSMPTENCFSLDVQGGAFGGASKLATYFLGGGPYGRDEWRDRHAAVYTTRAEAIRDATDRMARRKSRSSRR